MTHLDRVAQDYRVHRDEIHSKLVAIMRERLLVHLRSLPGVADGYCRPDDSPAEQQPSNFARALTKEVGVLHRILSPLLLEADLRSIFSRVVALFHVQLADSFSKIDTPTPQSKRRMYRDVDLILQCMRSLPGNILASSFEGRQRELDQFVVSRFGNSPPP
ncbi:hypothetical protein CLOM_g12189 [Closterium sp. NIES-68]|nr:hypothetical protein CLOM_g12189 [Closterium sp. NIES-68]GJP72123.1 hypothetical protein CLOP_g2885 [Closterium sp. NIES-67]